MDKYEIILMVKKAIANNSLPFEDSDEFVELDGFDVDNIADEVYEALYNAGYRKVPEDSVVLSREEYERLVNRYKILINELEEENERLREENYIIKSNPPIIAGRSVGKTIRAKLIDYDKLKQFNESLKDRIAELENKIKGLQK